jgi:hypothetical protein
MVATDAFAAKRHQAKLKPPMPLLFDQGSRHERICQYSP